MRAFLRSFFYAFEGLAAAFRSEMNFRIHCLVALMVLIAGWLLNLGRFEWLWIMLAIILVLFAELLNTAIETLVDLVSPHNHPLAKKAKDISAASVLVFSIFALICGLVIFIPKILMLL